ncbi:S9 family peptidase [Dictyobacter arantiisoli]|uniref:Putative peptidase YuxL n=1 Tax=Dictyobacter arantiisoli TaxID=2014874 RepID=A0A5A5TCZ3_9CHLR|nr:prolyl oligopeptidase family serine peptidase [Dictyobacter arantiisoli]GCF08794.1 putative peptidase YuxL [Dictyobacter arantiisoli]
MAITHTMTLDDLWLMQNMGEIALSPDGRRVAFVLSGSNKEKNSTFSTIYLLYLDAQGYAVSEPRPLTSGLKNDAHPIWAPDSRRLLFISNRENGSQLWQIDTDGGEARQLTNLFYGVSEAAWSPDGQQIAFTAPTLAALDDDVLLGRKSLDEGAKKALAEQECLRLRTVQRIYYRHDGLGIFQKYVHLFVMPAPKTVLETIDPSLIRRLSSGAYSYQQPQWTPDSQEIGVLRNPGERDGTFAIDLWAIEVATATARCLTEGNIEITTFSWSPDGQAAAVIGALDIIKHSPTLYRLYLVTRHGNEGDHPLCISPDFERDANINLSTVYGMPGPYRPQWSSDGQKLYFLATEAGCSHIYQLTVVWRSITQITSGPVVATFLSLFPDGGHLLVAQESADHPWELYLLTLTEEVGGEEERLTWLYDQWLAERCWGTSQRIIFTGAESKDIEGWLIKPVDACVDERYPLIVRIHGGPNFSYSVANAFDPYTQCLTGLGYAVFYCNPHGSTGYGEDFLNGSLGDWGGADFQDIMCGVDACIKLGVADPERLAVMGSSYGENDLRCSIEQADQFYAALKMIDKAPVEFVRIPASWHTGAEKPALALLAWEKTIAWFDKYLKAQPEQ